MRTAVLGVMTLSTLLLAGSARAQVLGETVPASTSMGAPGQVVITGDFDISFNYDTDAEDSTLSLSPAVDYFIAPQLSVGGQIIFQHAASNSGGPTPVSFSTTVFGIAPRVGFNVPLHDMFSVYPRGGIGLVRASSSVPGTSGETFLSLELGAPFLFHPVSHFFIGLGPYISWDLAGGTAASRTVNIGLATTVGGWFDW